MIMIGCVCLNAALDLTYEVDDLRPGASHRVRHMYSRAGGKAVNVARVLRQLGDTVPDVMGFAGGQLGYDIRDDLEASGIDEQLTATKASARRTVTVVAPDSTTVFNEPGGPVTVGEWRRFIEDFEEATDGLDAVVISGSLPTGVPIKAYRALTEVARRRGVPVVLDAEGLPFRAALTAQPELVVPNHIEAGSLLGQPVDTVADAVAAARRLTRGKTGSAVITRGPAGLVAVRDTKAVEVAPGAAVDGNPTGAGDALAAVLARHLAGGDSLDWHAALREAVAVSAGAVARPVAGEFDPSVTAEVRRTVSIKEA